MAEPTPAGVQNREAAERRRDKTLSGAECTTDGADNREISGDAGKRTVETGRDMAKEGERSTIQELQ